MPDQRPEWDAKGYLPTYEIKWANRDRPEVRIQDYKDGRCRGFVLVGREFRVPAKLPKDLRIALEYETFCDVQRNLQGQPGDSGQRTGEGAEQRYRILLPGTLDERL